MDSGAAPSERGGDSRPEEANLWATDRAAPPASVEARAPKPDAADEVLLGFAMGVDSSGRALPLSDSLVLATILCAVDAERSRRTFVWSRAEEVVEAVAPVYWPFLVLPTPVSGRVALFDGTGVWRQSFRHSKLPPVEPIRAALGRAPPSAELAAWLRALRTPMLYDTVPDTLTVEGLLPSNLPLLPDILTQSEFRTEPVSPYAGFLPTRRPIGWYESAVAQIVQSLQQFDTELAEIQGIRSAIAEFCQSAAVRLDGERKQLQVELTSRSRFYAHAEMERDVDSVHASIRDQIRTELDRIRGSYVVVSEARAVARVGGLLVQRANGRRQDPTPQKERIRGALEAERRAEREIREARERIATLQERERDSYAILTDRVAVVEQSAADELSTHELLRDDVFASGSDLLASFDRQIARREAERAELASHLLSLPALDGIRTLWFPLWVAILSGGDRSRCVVFPPMRVREGVGVGASIKTLFGGVVLPLEPRTAQFGQSIRQTLESTVENDPWLSGVTRQIVRAADATADPEFLQRLARGLSELRQAGWITAEQERGYFDVSSRHLRSRPMGTGLAQLRASYVPDPSSPGRAP